jgi:hypothetical protein
METLEGDLDTLRGFGTTDQGAELRSLKRNLTFLAKRMESTRASPLEELRTWFELFGERLRKVATSPAALTTGDGVLAKKEAGLYNFLRGFSAVISKVAHGADGDSPMGDAPETTQDAEQFRAYGAIARQFAHSIDTLFQAIETAEQLLEAAHKSLLDHCDGYEAATVFLQRSQNPIEELKTLLTTPCRKVFFKHVFGAHLDAKHRPSSLSQWREAVRMAMHRLR